MILTRKVALGMAGVAAAGVLGTAGVAAATSQNAAPTATASAAPGSGTATPADKAGTGTRHKIRRAAIVRGMHGEWVVKGKDGKPVTLLTIRGEITAVSPTSVTVKAEDGVSETFTVWVALGLLIPTLLGGLLTLSWSGALLGFIWGGLARIFLVHHVTWSINSVCHLWGSRPFRSHDESRNNVVFGVLAMGEGWHNNHHAFPTSARHGLRWWQVDLSYYVIRTMECLGLAWQVRTPAPAAMEAKRVR